MNFFAKGKHGFLRTTTDKDFCILADSDICPVIGWTDIIGNRLRPFIHDIFIRCPADSRRDSPCQDTSGKCRNDNAGQGRGAGVAGSFPAAFCEFRHDNGTLPCFAVNNFVDSIHFNSPFNNTLLKMTGYPCNPKIPRNTKNPE